MAIERLDQIANKKDQELVSLLQDLVRIPSWVPTDPELKSIHNENQVVEFLESWLKKNTNMDVKRQKLDGGRYNLIAAKGNADLVFLAHTDTVEESLGSPYGAFSGEIHDGKIWGLGSTDMKSGIATMIQALSLTPDVNNTWLFLYADEEKDFLGMHGILKDYSNLKPKLLVSSDGSGLRFGHGCRGLIELRGVVTGVSGHPAKGTGISATMKGFEGLFDFQEILKEYKHPQLGGTSLNVTDVLGGKLQEESFDSTRQLIKVGTTGNEIPDVMQFRLDIRPGNPDLTFERVVNILKDCMKKQNLKFELTEEKHSYSAWYTDLRQVDEFVEIAKKAIEMGEIKIDQPGESGYLDLQMFWDVVGRPPALMFGGGEGSTAHKPEEHIKIENLIKERDFFKKVLEKNK